VLSTFDSQMKCHHVLFSCVFAMCGCKYYDIATPIPPLKEEVSAEHKYSAEAIRFLDSSNVTRAEVVSTLGSPLVESSESRVLLYSWETTRTLVPFQIVSVDRDPGSGAETTTSLSPQPAGSSRR